MEFNNDAHLNNKFIKWRNMKIRHSIFLLNMYELFRTSLCDIMRRGGYLDLTQNSLLSADLQSYVGGKSNLVT